MRKHGGTCWSVALWFGGRAMSVSGACVAAGVGSRVRSWRSARFGVVAVCGRLLGVASACVFVPGRGLGCCWWWAPGWCVVCWISGDGAGGGGVWCGAGVVRWYSCVGELCCPMSMGSASWCAALSLAGLSGEVRLSRGRGCGMVWWCWTV